MAVLRFARELGWVDDENQGDEGENEPNNGDEQEAVDKTEATETAAQSALKSVRGLLIGVVAVAGVLVVLTVISWVLGFGRYARGVVLLAHGGWPLWLVLAILAALVVLIAKRPKLGFGVLAAMVAGTVISGLTPSSPPVGNLLSELNASGYNEARDYVAATEVVEGERPGYDQRTALRIGDLSIRRSLSGIVGDISEPIRVNDEWCAVVAKKGSRWNTWSDSVVCISDTGVTRQASFPSETVPSIDSGWRKSRLGNAITSAAGLHVSWSEDEVYGAIVEVGGELQPRLYVPLRTPQGFDFSIPSMPAGVVVFGTDESGDYRVSADRQVDPGEYPGPVAGLNSAARVRESVNALNGFLPFKRETRSGDSLQPTFVDDRDEDEEEQVEIDSDDPNAANPTEFVLYRDGVPYAVTPLTSFGGASTITAYLEVRLDTVRSGEPLEAKVYRLPTSRAANSSTVNAIRVLYGQDLADDDEIYEVTPLEPGQSLITIARGDQVRFTAIAATEVSSGRPVGEICVFNRTGRQVDCTNLDGDARPLGTLITRQGATSNDGTDADSFDGDLAGVPTDALLAELERRLAAAESAGGG